MGSDERKHIEFEESRDDHTDAGGHNYHLLFHLFA